MVIDLKPLVGLEPGIRSMDISPEGILLIGTYGAKVIEVDPAKPSLIKKTITEGHFRDRKLKIAEVWGCCTHPTQPLFCSSGGDKTVRIWSKTNQIKVSDQF